MQEEEPVHMKRHRKNTYMMWREKSKRESEQSIQMCNSPNEQTTRCDTHVQIYIRPFAYVGSNCTAATMEK